MNGKTVECKDETVVWRRIINYYLICHLIGQSKWKQKNLNIQNNINYYGFYEKWENPDILYSDVGFNERTEVQSSFTSRSDHPSLDIFFSFALREVSKKKIRFLKLIVKKEFSLRFRKRCVHFIRCKKSFFHSMDEKKTRITTEKRTDHISVWCVR